MKPFKNFHSKTCLATTEDEDDQTRAIFMEDSQLRVLICNTRSFHRDFKEILNYPIEKAAGHFLDQAVKFGAAREVVDMLKEYVEISQEQLNKILEVQETDSKSKGMSGEYRSAAEMFRKLILDGKLSDDEIFKEVKQEFGLEDSKRSYVKWYRKELIRKGKLKNVE